ncbi:NERD domain-containing protein [Mycolicibacterium elephantis]|uniref:NERD domain-containing protein n=1 Tax=Mycolicibacterium elephantis DSM 44368 TaxID=1335622 RepID=A0A439DV23_9MYCO|nr:NERD domain-containing protein [Mycolicibacterium elephantis]RWA20893.1 hypothetical protein MELE44368_02770 [Mycolicibacterium elephantis DSM 44368]
MEDGRWVTIADSQFAHEKQGLDVVKQLLPDAPPFRAWANFEFRDNRGRWHEVDLLVLARDTLYLIELKHYRGILRGNDHVWLRDGHRAEDSPLLLARRKAQYFASLLPRQRIDEKSVRLLPGVTAQEFSAAFIGINWQLPAVDASALRGLKFSSALPDALARQTLSARLSDPCHAQRVSGENWSILR